MSQNYSSNNINGQSILSNNISSSTTNPPTSTNSALPNLDHDISEQSPPTTVTHDWHQHISTGLRDHLVQKIVKAIFPNDLATPTAQSDARLSALFVYARRVEEEMYSRAGTRDEYYHLLAEKIYKIQKELEDRRCQRQGQNSQNSQNSQGQFVRIDPNSLPAVNGGVSLDDCDPTWCGEEEEKNILQWN